MRGVVLFGTACEIWVWVIANILVEASLNIFANVGWCGTLDRKTDPNPDNNEKGYEKHSKYCFVGFGFGLSLHGPVHRADRTLGIGGMPNEYIAVANG